jgi:hypothetical protein
MSGPGALAALLLLGAMASAGAATVKTRQAIEAPCVSYWGGIGKDWATVLIEERDILSNWPSMGADLLQFAGQEKDAWGCRKLAEVRGEPHNIIFELLEAGRAMVIDDATGKAVAQVLVRTDGPKRKTYHLKPGSDAFLVRTKVVPAPDPRPAPRKKWSIEKLDRTGAHAGQIDFIERFVGACRSEDPESKSFVLAHTRLPFEAKVTRIHDEDSVTTSDLSAALDGICTGKASLDDVSLKIESELLTLDLAFVSGPNRTLLFKPQKGRWELVAVEWIDR